MNDSRAIAIDELTEAFVTVTGYGMDELSQTVSISREVTLTFQQQLSIF